MAIKLSDCPPALHAAIMAQLEKEGRNLPKEAVTMYAVANYVWQTDRWHVGPETSNLKLVQRLVSRLQSHSPRAAYMAAKGTPLSVVLHITRQ